jgi:hypothetical protein
MQPRRNFNVNTQPHMPVGAHATTCPKCGQRTLAADGKKEGARCRNIFCGYRTSGNRRRFAYGSR